jgi:hypothetical protein
VINLQQLENLDLFTAVKLATSEARSKEEAKSKVYVVEEESDKCCQCSELTLPTAEISATTMPA